MRDEEGFKLVGSGLLGFRPNKLKQAYIGSFLLLITPNLIIGSNNHPIIDNKHYFKS